MRILKTTVLALILVSSVAMQALARPETPPGISVVKTDWVYAPNDNRQDAEAARIRGDQVYTSGGIEPTSVRRTPDMWEASVVLKNNGDKTIKAIKVDLVFTNASNKTEVLRYRLSSKNDFRPGETLTLRRRVNEPHKQRAVPSTVVATRQVVITRVEYADGTTWLP
jgi:hypothetical protein